jgi:hypothetical protein
MRASLSSDSLFSFVRIGVGLYSIYFFTQVLFGSPPLFLDNCWWCYFGLAIGLLFILGLARRWVALPLWFCLVMVLRQNPLLYEVHLDYWGWLLWLFAFVPIGEPYSSWPRPRAEWQMPGEFRTAALFCLGSSYTLSGLTKLLTPDWNTGHMLEAYFAIGFAPVEMSTFMLTTAKGYLPTLAWFVGGVEAVALPLLLMRRTRPWIWLLLTLGQMQLICLSHLGHIAVMLLLFHLLVFERQWVQHLTKEIFMRFFRWLIFSGLLVLFLPYATSIVIAVALAVTAFRREWRWQVLALTSVCIWLLPSPLWQTTSIFDLPFYKLILFKIICIGSAYSIAHICLWTQRRVRGWHFIPFILFVCLIFLSERLTNDSLSSVFVYCLTYIFYNFIWSLTIVGLMPQLLSQRTKFQVTALLLPFWSFGSSIIPLGPALLKIYDAKDELDLNRIQWAGLRLLLIVIGLASCSEVFCYWAFQTRFSPFDLNNLRTNLAGLYDAFVLFHQHWPLPILHLSAIVAPVIELIFYMSISFGVSVSVAQMMGFNLPRPVNHPYLAVNFNNFLGRILPYYNDLLLKIFFSYFRRLRRPFESLSARLSFAIFCTVWMGGFTYHYLRDLLLSVGHESIFAYSLNYLNILPYYFLLGIVSASATYFHRHKTSRNIVMTVFRSFGYLILYSLIFSINLFVRHDHRSWSQIWHIWARFF